MNAEAVQSVWSARDAQVKAIQKMDKDIETARALIRDTIFESDDKESAAHRHLADLLRSRSYLRRNLEG